MMIQIILKKFNKRLFSTASIKLQQSWEFIEIQNCIRTLKLNINNMNACYISDLHIEFCDTYPEIKNDAEVLILAGDIGNPYENMYTNFLKSVSGNFKKIFLITGNHEYYSHGNTIKETDEYIENLILIEQMENVIFLNNKIYDYNNFRFIGTTLWSQIHDNNPESLTACFDYINDFDVSKKHDNVAIQNYNNLFDENYNFLKQSIDETVLPVVVISHHLPSFKLIDKKYYNYGKGKSPASSGINQCFASDCDKLMTPDVLYWFYGHTHSENDCVINATRLLCNPNGYPDENENVDKNKIVVIHK